MKLYKPLFSIVIIVIQLILSLKDYYYFVKWAEDNPELNRLATRYFLGDSLFLFVLIIGLYEMRTSHLQFKKIIRILLACIILAQFVAPVTGIGDIFYAAYNTAWFSAIVAVILFIFFIGKYSIKKITKRKQNSAEKASRQQSIKAITLKFLYL